MQVEYAPETQQTVPNCNKHTIQIYIDDLNYKSNATKLGCKMGGIQMNYFNYADDMVIHWTLFNKPFKRGVP